MKSLAAVILSAVILGACGPASVDADQAAEIAREFVVAGQPSGALFREITIGQPQWQTTHWRVQVDAVVDYPPRIPVHYLIDVDGSSGRATIHAQG